MSGAASTNPSLGFGPAGPSSNFQSPDPSSSSPGYNSVGGFPAGFGRVKPETSSYSYDEQAPRSQQHGNYTHHDLSGAGTFSQTQALGGLNPSTSQHYADPVRSAPGGQAHYASGHTRHQSLNSGVNQLGLGGGSGAYSFGDVNANQYNNYNLVPAQRSPSGRSSGLPSEISPTRSRFPSAGYNDPRTLNRPPSRPVGLGVSVTPGPSSDESITKAEGSSPRSLKRSADPLEDLRSSSEHAQLRRPASFPVLATGAGNMYGRPMSQDARSAQTVGRRTGRGGMSIPGQLTPGRSNAMLPVLGGGFYEGDTRRESLGSNATMQSPVTYHGGSGSSDELGLSSGGIPQLMRATQIPGSMTPAPVMAHDPMYSPPGGSSGGSPRAKLELHGNLNDMAVGWSHDEWRSGRRLVQFWRRQEGTTIHATFRPILPSQYVPNSIVISCIFREDKNECFVTSVDTIYLLEALVASRFTVEEKNRIRRNLEGFRPITVSKNKRECERFFKLIMSFPNPKPRNIEKDVKVFPWKVLASALCKIIGKYSASYEGGPPVLADLGPEAQFGGAMGASSLSSVDLSGGHYRDPSYPGASPSIKDTRLPESSFDYDRQSGAAGMYGVPNPGLHHSAHYGGGNAWNMGNQGIPFSGPGAQGGYPSSAGSNVPFSTGSGSHSHTHSASSYDGFGAGHFAQGQTSSDSANVYGQHTPAQEDYSAAPTPHSQGHSTSTLAEAASDYYADRR